LNEKNRNTGQAGFIGTHSFQFFWFKKRGSCPNCIQDAFFDDKTKLEEFACQCDVIIHLAALTGTTIQTIYEPTFFSK